MVEFLESQVLCCNFVPYLSLVLAEQSPSVRAVSDRTWRVAVYSCVDVVRGSQALGSVSNEARGSAASFVSANSDISFEE